MEEDYIPLDPGFSDRFTTQRRPKCQLYVVSPPALAVETFADRLRSALGGGPVAAFQLRLKEVDDDTIRRAVEALLPICNEHEVAFILNDRADLGAEMGTDGGRSVEILDENAWSARRGW